MTATIANDVDLSDVMIGFFAKEVLSLLDVRRRFCGCFSPFNRSFEASEVACTGLHEVTKGGPKGPSGKARTWRKMSRFGRSSSEFNAFCPMI